MTDYNTTLAALAVAAAKQGKAETATAEKATAHAPFAIAAIFDGEKTVEAWTTDACTTAEVKSKKGHKNAAALREGGYGGLYNMAIALKWLTDNREEYPAINGVADMFLRRDTSGDMRRNYLVASRAMLPAEARIADIEAVAAAYDAKDDDDGKATEAEAYWKAVEAPVTFAAFMADCKAVAKAPKADAFTTALDKVVKSLGEMELEELAKRQDELLTLLAAIKGAEMRLTAESEGEGEGEGETFIPYEMEAPLVVNG